MTVQSETSRVVYTGDGVTTVFSVPFYFLADADVKAIKTEIATGTETILALTTDFTLTGAGTNPPTGNLTILAAAYSSSYKLTIYRDPVATQLVSLIQGDPLPVKDHVEKPLDRLTMLVQRLKDRIARAVLLSDGDTGSALVVPSLASRASKYWAWDAAGALIAAAAAPPSAVVSSFMETVLDDTTQAAAHTTLGTAGFINGTYGVRGLVGANNGGAPTTTYDMDADVVVLRNASNYVFVSVAPIAVSVNVGTAGPAANGRDQAGAFTASTFVHLYFIYNPTSGTVAGIASAAAPPTGPTLPSGYTHWAYATTIRFNGSSQLVSTYTRGGRAYYATPVSVLSTNAPSTTQVDLSTPLAVAVPSIAAAYFGAVQVSATAGGGGGINHSLNLRIVTGVTYEGYLVLAVTSNSNGQNSAFEMPYTGFLGYLVSNNTNVASEQVDVTVRGYSLPNGS